MGLSPLDLKMFRKVWPAHAISKIIFILGSNKFVACLEHIRSYAWSFGHSDPDPSSVQAHHQAVRFSPTQGLVPTEFENVPPGLTRRGRRRRWILAHFSGFIWRPFFTYVQRSSRYLLGYSGTCHTVGQIPPKCKETSNLIDIDMVYFIFVCFLKLILNNSKPQNQMCDWNQKCFCFVLQKS